eukprot:m51a1_g13728 hypothetical protein (121) ;mRNA; r:123304-123774
MQVQSHNVAQARVAAVFDPLDPDDVDALATSAVRAYVQSLPATAEAAAPGAAEAAAAPLQHERRSSGFASMRTRRQRQHQQQQQQQQQAAATATANAHARSSSASPGGAGPTEAAGQKQS